jgi:hypothetical protein
MEQGSRGAGEKGSRGEGKQGSREAGEQLRMTPYFMIRLLALLENIRLVWKKLSWDNHSSLFSPTKSDDNNKKRFIASAPRDLVIAPFQPEKGHFLLDIKVFHLGRLWPSMLF